MADQQWVDGYQRYVYNVLSSFITDQERLRKYTGQDAMETWIRAVTDSSVNPVFNYEDLEAVGDFILKGTFVVYLTKRFKNIDKDRINNLNSYYMRESYQKKLSPMIGLDKWIRTDKMTDKVLEDTFESFTGALFTISDQLDNIGRAYANCFNFIAWVFNKVKIDPTIISNPKGFVQQTLQRFGLGDVYERALETGKSYELIMSERAIRFFSERDRVFRSRTIGAGQGTDYTSAVARAYEDAMQTFFAAGVTPQWIQEEVINWNHSNPAFQPYVTKAYENIRARGMKRMYFEVPQHLRKEGQKLVVLYGINTETNEHFRLLSIDTVDELEGKKKLMELISKNEF